MTPAFASAIVTCRQLRIQIQAYIEKKHYHVGKLVTHVGFVWHPDTLLQPNDTSEGISFSCREYR